MTVRDWLPVMLQGPEYEHPLQVPYVEVPQVVPLVLRVQFWLSEVLAGVQLSAWQEYVVTVRDWVPELPQVPTKAPHAPHGP